MCGCRGNKVPCWCVVAVVTEMEEMKRQMEEELRKKEEELENLSKTYEQRMAEASQANKVKNKIQGIAQTKVIYMVGINESGQTMQFCCV